ncbi:MAG TPA: phosphoglycerate dehydrogenase [Chthonomonadaceae bacterium]|nr:phosphoglycerate dehydrogenase [Chthonomonadaceae bacterium]
MSWRVAVTARAVWTSGLAAVATLEAAGCEAVHPPKYGPIPENELIDILQGCDAVVAASDPYTAAVFAACPQLQIVSRCGIGIDSVDLEAATRAGVVVTNTPGAMADGVADYTFGLMLALARKIPAADALMRSGAWGELPGVLVVGKTLGLIGFGRIAQGVARRAGGFAMRLLVCDPPLAEAGFAGEGLPPFTFVGMEELLPQSDFVSVHAPATPETRHLLNAARFAQMKPSAYLINTARGALVDPVALLSALEQGQIAGAAIDVYEQEPLPADSPLRSAPRCLLSPHNAFNAAESVEAMSLQSAENALTLLKGERPDNVVNPEVWRSPALRVALIP